MDTQPTGIYTYGHTLALHDALPISACVGYPCHGPVLAGGHGSHRPVGAEAAGPVPPRQPAGRAVAGGARLPRGAHRDAHGQDLTARPESVDEERTPPNRAGGKRRPGTATPPDTHVHRR